MKKIIAALTVLVGSGLAWAGCSQNATPVTVRSLERSGKAAFLCIRFPRVREPSAASGPLPKPGIQLDGCFDSDVAPSQFNYGIPHVISLVTQTARGEVAVVDVTSRTVVDVDTAVPGFNFLPVGAMPTDVVATHGSNASFVGIGDPTRPAIFGLPSTKLPLWRDSTPVDFGSWPACALPPGGVPSEMVIVSDTTASPSDPGGKRAFCDGTPGSIPAEEVDITPEVEMFGRQKLAVLLPELGEVDIIDAQELLARPPGEFEPCKIEHRVFLSGDPNALPQPPTPKDAGPESGSSDASDDGPSDASIPDGGVADSGDPGDADDAGDGADDAGGGADGMSCMLRRTPSAPPSTTPHPYALALSDDGRLYISDDNASVIHVVDVRDPCAATEMAPLLPYSAADPSRAVVSGAITVSPLTSDGKRFVYASDLKSGGSLMVFDVSSTSTERRPIQRNDRLYNPLEPPDRLNFAAPIESMTFATHEVPLAPVNDTTGQIPRGVPCDPANGTDPNRPPDDYAAAGAQPRRLRGTFAFLALANGDLAVLDLDDYDQACRRPRLTDEKALGCEGRPIASGDLPSASNEASCNVVERHRQRSTYYFINSDRAGRHAPAMQTYPVLFERDGTALTIDPSRPATLNLPKLLGPALDAQSEEARPLLATVLSSGATPNLGLSSNPRDALDNWVTFDLREPRAHPAQAWTVTYEGVLPWFSGRRGRLQCADPGKDAVSCELGDNPSHLELYDSSVGFCDGGAQGEGMDPGGDLLEIVDDMPDPADPYWTSEKIQGVCNRQECEAMFGTLEAPRVIEDGNPVGRDVVIAKSYQGKLSLKNTEAMYQRQRHIPMACCFPYPVTYTIRANGHWIVNGQATGFAHRLVPDPSETDPTKQACVVSCDENLRLRNGRVVARPAPDPLPEPVPAYDDLDSIFHNAQLRFNIWDKEPTCEKKPCAGRVRDRYFAFQETGGFVPMRFPLSSSQPVMPSSVRFVRGLYMLAIPDPVQQGLLLFDLNRLSAFAPF